MAVGAMVPGLARDPLKALPPDREGLLRLVHRWRDEAVKAGRDGFWLARFLRAKGVEAYVIHPTSVSVCREPRRAKTDRLDVGLLQRCLMSWLRGETKALQHGGAPVARRGGCETAAPRARATCPQAHGLHQPDEGDAGAVGHRDLTPNCATHRRNCDAGHTGRLFHPAQYPGRAGA